MENDYLKLYAAETERLLWSRGGMDATRNLAALILFGTIVVAFGFFEPTSHRVPFFSSLAVFALLLFEARLFRHHAVSQQRVRLLERNFLPPLFDQEVVPEKDWQRQLAAGYAHPVRPAFLEALAHRIYKNYFLIFLALDTGWLSKVYLSPQPANSFSQFVRRLDLGFLSGWVTLGFVLVFWTAFTVAVFRAKRAKKQKDYLNEY